MLRRHHQHHSFLELALLISYVCGNLGTPPGPLPIVEGVGVLVRAREISGGGRGLLQ